MCIILVYSFDDLLQNFQLSGNLELFLWQHWADMSDFDIVLYSGCIWRDFSYLPAGISKGGSEMN